MCFPFFISCVSDYRYLPTGVWLCEVDCRINTHAATIVTLIQPLANTVKFGYYTQDEWVYYGLYTPSHRYPFTVTPISSQYFLNEDPPFEIIQESNTVTIMPEGWTELPVKQTLQNPVQAMIQNYCGIGIQRAWPGRYYAFARLPNTSVQYDIAINMSCIIQCADAWYTDINLGGIWMVEMTSRHNVQKMIVDCIHPSSDETIRFGIWKDDKYVYYGMYTTMSEYYSSLLQMPTITPLMVTGHNSYAPAFLEAGMGFDEKPANFTEVEAREMMDRNQVLELIQSEIQKIK